MNTPDDYNNILSNIQNLQAAQKSLHTELSKLPPTQNIQREKLLITQIDNINAQKVDLFKNLHALQSVIQHDVDTSKDDIQEKLKLTNLVEEQLNNSRTQIEQSRNKNINNLRMTQINDYYTGKYGLYLVIFRYIIYTCIVLLFVALLRQRFTSIISSRISYLLAFIIIFVAGFFITNSIFDLTSRNNLVINEFDWAVEASEENNGPHNKNPEGTGGTWLSANEQFQKDLKLLKLGDCLGAECCKGDGLTWDPTNLICKLDPGKKTKSEGFTGGGTLSPATLGDKEDHENMIKKNSGYYAFP